jgi:hypothetical protein
MDAIKDVGAEAEKKRRRGWWTLLAAALASGFAAGLGFSMAKHGGGFLEGTIPRGVAIAIAVSYVATILIGTVLGRRLTDELERSNNQYGLAMGASAVLLVYPAWWILWRGRVVMEPQHGALFILLFAVAVAAYGWKKFR